VALFIFSESALPASIAHEGVAVVFFHLLGCCHGPTAPIAD
jgi:hypothetical protein